MKESIKMENYDGYLNKFQKIERTKILPLRWIGNLCGSIGTEFLVKAIYLKESGNIGWRYSINLNVWIYLKIFNQKWGTYYSIDIDKLP